MFNFFSVLKLRFVFMLLILTGLILACSNPSLISSSADDDVSTQEGTEIDNPDEEISGDGDQGNDADEDGGNEEEESNDVIDLSLYTDDLERYEECSGSHNAIYIWPYAHHYLGGGGTYPRNEDLLAASAVFNELNVPGTFYFDGILMKEILEKEKEDEDGTLEKLVANSNLRFGYHGDETHGPYPVPTILTSPTLSRTSGMNWDDAYADAYLYGISQKEYSFSDESAAILEINRFSGGTLTSEKGGIKLVQDKLEELGSTLSIGIYKGLSSPPVMEAFTKIKDIDVIQGSLPVTKHTYDPARYTNDEIREYLSMGGNNDFFFYYGKPHTKEVFDNALGFDSLDDLKSSLETIDRSYARFSPYPVMGEPGNWLTLRNNLAYLKNTFIPEDGNAKFVSVDDFPNMIQNLYATGSVDRKTAYFIANYIKDTFKSTGRLPDYVVLKKSFFTLAQSFEILSRLLNTYALDGKLAEEVEYTGIQGPIGEYEDLVVASGSVSFSDVLSSTSEVISEFETNATDSKPYHVPYTVSVGSKSLNAAQYLLVLANAYINILSGDPADVGINDISMIPPYGDKLDRLYTELSSTTVNPFWYMKLQLWTVKPLKLKCHIDD